MFRVIKNSEEIFGVSSTRSKIAMDLEDTTRQIISHLIKLYLYQESNDRDHRRQEIYNFLHNIPKLKINKKFPSKDFILNNTININLDMIQILYEDIQIDYSQQNRERNDTNLNDIKIIILEYYNWLADILSRRGQVPRNTVYDKLKQLGL